MTAATELRLTLPDGSTTSAMLLAPAAPRAAYVFAHGAGAGMRHAFMGDLSAALAERGVATLRYQFPFMERGGHRTDPPAVAHPVVRAAARLAHERMAGVPLFAGGKSFGGRMTSQAQASEPLEGVRGLAFVGFPLHPSGKPGTERAVHLEDVQVPMLFLQGTRDELAGLALIRQVVEPLAPRATLHLVEDGDHSFHVRASSGRNDAQVMQELAQAMGDWFGEH
ncbi:MAG TPA: alpha/beta family hydrolase [Burkholderiaceae bacterium]|jgi:hypothetical protein|nr:alpha/beta family hydrolase [Burkholderiaceae bacterium]